jgi:hypothetical protein
MSTMMNDGRRPTVAAVDALIDESGARIELPDDAELVIADDGEEAVGGTSPANWSRWALIGIAVVAFALLMLQVFQGAPGSDVEPGTPASTPVADAPTPTPAS